MSQRTSKGSEGSAERTALSDAARGRGAPSGGALASAASVTAVGSLVTGLAHEINNPLAVVLANVEEAVRVAAELARGERPSLDLGELHCMLQEAYASAQRVQFIVRDLRPFASAELRRGRVELDSVVNACCTLAFADIRHRARLVKELTAAVPVFGSEAQLAQVVLNLLVNAAHATPEGAVDRNEIRVSTRRHGGGAVVLEVSDTGSGVSPSLREAIFEPLVTTRPPRPGMGLAICRAIVAAHAGELSLDPREGGGTVARVKLPTFESATAETASSERLAEAEPTPRLLVIDDDLLVLRALTRVLGRDFSVTAARSGREALDLIHAGEDFDAMICDLVMPELSGMELFKILEREANPLAKRTVFLTGAAFSGPAQAFLEAAGQPHLDKPADMRAARDLLMNLTRSGVPPR